MNNTLLCHTMNCFNADNRMTMSQGFTLRVVYISMSQMEMKPHSVRSQVLQRGSLSPLICDVSMKREKKKKKTDPTKPW